MLGLKLLSRFATTAAIVAVPVAAFAVPLQNYSAHLSPLNDSGVSGNAFLRLNSNNNTLNVKINAQGLEPGQPHAQHIHGRLSNGMSGNPVNSVSPTAADDADGDGFVELNEAAPDYGPILVPLTVPPGGGALTGPFPTAPDGQINYSQTFDLNDSGIFNNDYTRSDLGWLGLREIVIHGLTVSANDGAGTDGEVDGTAGYKAVLPVATGEISAVPEPGDLAMLGIGVIALGGLAATRRRSGSSV